VPGKPSGGKGFEMSFAQGGADWLAAGGWLAGGAAFMAAWNWLAKAATAGVFE
jgi:hypothetical protein